MIVLALSAVFGLVMGALFAYAGLPRFRPALWWPAAAVFVAGGFIATLAPWGEPAAPFVMLAGLLVAQALVGGARVAAHPMATGLGYWERVQLAAIHPSALRRYWRDEAATGVGVT